MRTTLRLILIFMCLTACVENESPEKTKQQIADVTSSLIAINDAGILIRSITRTGNEYQISFEDGHISQIRSSLIKTMEYDSANWKVRLEFSDKSSVSVNFIGPFAITPANVTVNPFGKSPLTAQININMPVKGKCKVIVRGKKPDGIAIEKTFEQFSDNHALPILGLYENYRNVVEVSFMNADNVVRCSTEIEVTTPALVNKPSLNVQVNLNTRPESSDVYLISNLKAAIDQNGELRWHYSGAGGFFRKLANGNFIINSQNNLSFDEVTMLGEFVKTYKVPAGVHHEVLELPSGNFLAASHSPAGAPLEDVVVEVSRVTGEVIKSWDFNLILDPQRKGLPDMWDGDWLHINAMHYDATDNSIVISGRTQCAVVKIDYATGALTWILANHQEWNSTLSAFLLKPIDSTGMVVNTLATDFWPYGQHATQVLPNGNILVFDNGAYRGYYDNPGSPENSYSRAVEYKIDELNKTVQIAWQFDNDKKVFTKLTGYTQDLPKASSRLIAYMWVSPLTPRIVEVDKVNQIVYDATINAGVGAYYRTTRLDLYQGIK